jgi:hypothetical protein
MGAGASTGVSEAIHAATKEELKSVLPKSGDDREKLNKVLEELDLEGGFGLDHEGRVFWNPEGRLKSIFEECDADNSGSFDMQEFVNAFQRDEDMAQEYGLASFGHLQNPEDIMMLFEMADDDKSGLLSWEEFRDLMTGLRNGEYDEALEKNQKSRYGHNRQSIMPEKIEDMVLSMGFDVREWHLDYWKLADKDQSLLVMQAIKEWGCFNDIPVMTKTLRNYVHGVRSQYNDCHYHNFFHALATVHYCFKLLDSTELLQETETLDRFSILISALCHDAGHYGRNSTFEVLTLGTLALRYNDRSPLENHHCAVAFAVALGPDADASCNIFREMEDSQLRHIRKRMVAGILATDMIFHNDHVKKLKTCSSPDEVSRKDDGEFLVELFLHAADIGNPFMPPEISYQWGQMIAKEFTDQVADERRLGLPVTSMMTGLTDPKKNAKSRVGFIDFVVTPLANPLFTLLKGLDVPKQHMIENREQEYQRSH